MNRKTKILRAQNKALKAAGEAARKRLGLETLATRNRDALDFHDLSVASIRDAITDAFHIAFEAGAKVGYDAGFDDGEAAARLLKPVPPTRRAR